MFADSFNSEREEGNEQTHERTNERTNRNTNSNTNKEKRQRQHRGNSRTASLSPPSTRRRRPLPACPPVSPACHRLFVLSSSQLAVCPFAGPFKEEQQSGERKKSCSAAGKPVSEPLDMTSVILVSCFEHLLKACQPAHPLSCLAG